jgi:Ca-activated chloride channel family protein
MPTEGSDIMHQRNNLLSTSCIFLLATALVAQQPTPAPDQGEAVFRSDTRLVVLHATVVDKNGQLITNLPQASFDVFEDNAKQQIKLFRREDIPVSLGLIIDNSGSMRDKRHKVEAAALTLVKASNPQDEMFVVNFNDEAFLDTKKDFTNDTKELQEALTKIDSRGGTAMRDALRMSIDHVRGKGKKDKKALLVVTDGNDNASIVTLENLVKAAQQSEVIVYTIGILNEEDGREAKRAKRALDALAEATGGQSYYPKDLADVERITRQVASDIRNQYTIGCSHPFRLLCHSGRASRAGEILSIGTLQSNVFVTAQGTCDAS